ncbi:amylo-alpha-1,6-glucosidase [Allorhizocola rhizosphaerae]|uniref:amylo-alpha-1,6-glucosidase n=1 Tax=Allorhizocola rhizosphaerae TaxID=1872709 RepID=UPI001B8B9697|nr:glycogen debranching protein [Allorhizocola rhizosphaerae]
MKQHAQFSIRDIPFSYCGSWFNFAEVAGEATHAGDVHLVSHQTRQQPVLRFTPQFGDGRARTTITAVPSRLTWTGEQGRIELAYETPDTVRVRGVGLGLRLAVASSRNHLLHDPVDGSWLCAVPGTGRRYRVTPLSPELRPGKRAITMRHDREWEIAIEEYDSARPPYRAVLTFDQIVTAGAIGFHRYADSIAPWRNADTPAAELAAYILWSTTVRPAGFVTLPAILGSKHRADKVWSWDHCVNALAVASGLPDLAWAQYRLPFEHQDDSGALPDSVSHSEVLYHFVKPPIHGWALHRLRQQIPTLGKITLTKAYRELASWTNFWLTTRRVPGHALAHYQHGSDSGWDSATTFGQGHATESADLAAFLVLQTRELADLACELGLAADAKSWALDADRMRAGLLELWTGERFAARAAGNQRTWTSDSLLDLMPIVLADQLPEDMRDALAKRIRAHLTEHGLATELPASPHYRAEGHWRGPISASATVLIEDGLRRSGYQELADEISDRFRALCEGSGFAENFDSLTGVALHERACTQTAGAYLLLAGAYVGSTIGQSKIVA